MKNLITQNYIFKVVIGKDKPKGYHVWCLALPGCHSQASTAGEARINIIEAIQGYRDI